MNVTGCVMSRSTENTRWSLRSQNVIIPKRQMDVAVHFMRLEVCYYSVLQCTAVHLMFLEVCSMFQHVVVRCSVL